MKSKTSRQIQCRQSLMSHTAVLRRFCRAGLVALPLLFAAHGALSHPAIGEELLAVGVARVDITPRQPVHLINELGPEELVGVSQQLYARAIAIGSDSQGPSLLVSFDGIGVPGQVTEEVARRLMTQRGIPRERFVVCATHTHWAPHLSKLLPTIYGSTLPTDQQQRVDQYTHRLTDWIEQAALDALQDRQPRRLSWDTGKVGFAANRRLEEGGRLVTGERLMFTYNPRAPVDHTLPVLFVHEPNGSLRSVLFSYACHNVSLTLREFTAFRNRVHGDWAGLAQEQIEANHPGCIAIATIGCGGDQRPSPVGGLEVAEAQAREVAAEVDLLLADSASNKTVTAAPTGSVERIGLPLTELPDRNTLLEYAAVHDQGRNAAARGFLARQMLDRLQSGQRPGPELPYIVQTWHFGDALALVFLAGEVVVDYSLRIGREFDRQRVFTVAYANATPCYIPSKRSLERGGYEADSSMNYYGFLRRLIPATEDLIVASVQRQLPATFHAPDTPAPSDWVELFNGRDLTGWVNVNGAARSWHVRDGMIVCSGHPRGFLRTTKMYENYVLELEWRHAAAGGNSGLFVHADALPQVGAPYPKSIEAQLLDGDHGSLFGIRGASIVPVTNPNKKGNTALAGPLEQRCRPAGQWNQYTLTCQDGTLDLAVNGRLVTQAKEASQVRGYICLQAEHSEVHFRHVRVRPLPTSRPPAERTAQADEGFVSLFDGLTFGGWDHKPGHREHWVAQDGVIDYDGQAESESRTDKDLWTRSAFGDFVLIADWRLPAKPTLKPHPIVRPNGDFVFDANGQRETVPRLDAGDSGLYLRGSSKSQVNIWSQLLGSGEINGYRTDRRLPDAIRMACIPTKRTDLPFGQWNRFVITMQGERLTIVLNGETVIDRAQLPAVPAAGPLGLQHHGDPVQFRNLFLRKLE